MIFPADYSLYRDLLVPASPEVRSFVAVRSARQALYQTAFQVRDDSRQWISVLDGTAHSSEVNAWLHGPHRLGLRLWSEHLKDSAAAEARLLAVADPLASLLTLVVEANGHTCSGDFLESLLHRYYRETRDYEAWLSQKPGLALVLLDTGGGRLSELRVAFQRTMQRTGEAAVDLQVRWLRAVDDSSELLGRVLAGHFPGSSHQPGQSGVDLPSVDELEDAIGRVQALTDKIPDPTDSSAADINEPSNEYGGDGFWEACHVIRQEGGRVVLGQVAPTPRISTEPPAITPPACLLGAKIAVRRFQHTPLKLPLAPLTLLISENASGKTTLMEALCLLYQDRPRLRLHLPQDARIWEDRERRQEGGGGPSIEVVSLVGGTSATGTVPIPAPASLVALFGDDAKLDQGLVGETALLTVWPILLHGESGEAARLRRAVVRLASSLDSLGARLTQWASRALSNDTTREVEKGEVDLGPILGPRFRAYLSEVVSPEMSEGGDEPLSSLSAKLKGARRRFLIPVSIANTYLANFLGWNQAQGHLPDWRALRNVDRDLGGQRQLRDLAASALNGYSALLDQDADAFWQGLESLVLRRSAVRSLEEALEDYFDVGLARSAEMTVRPNTARQVRRGQLARLARWIGVSGTDLPVLLLDEPLLGQDLTASAGLLGRYLRLRRRTEALRWARASQSASDNTKASESAVTLAWGRRNPACADETATDWLPLADPSLPGDPTFNLLPPQLVVTSNKPAVLAAAAEADGVILDREMRANLEGLIPWEWRPRVRDALRDCRGRYQDAMSAQGIDDWHPKMPAAVLRLYWQIPDGLDSVADPNAYADAVSRSLEKLGLHVLRAEAAELGATALARRLLQWLVLTDLLPAVTRDGDEAFEVSGVSTRAIPAAGGEVTERGPARLRRIGTWRESLPPEPASPSPTVEAEPEAEITPSGTTSTAVPKPAGIWYIEGPKDFSEADKEDRIPEQIEREVRRAGMRPWREGGPLAALSLTLQTGGVVALYVAGDDPIRTTPLTTLADALAEKRARELLTRLPADAPVEIGLTTHEEGRGFDPAVVFVLEGKQYSEEDTSDWREKTRALWQERVAAPLALLRRVLAKDKRTQALRFHAFCHPGAAIRAGAMFSHTSGFEVECLQNGKPWDLFRQPSYTRPPIVIDERGSPPEKAAETHLLLSFSRSVSKEYEDWKAGRSDRSPARIVSIAPASGPGPHAIAEEEVADWGEAVFAELSKARSSGSGPTRIFCAAPVALAMAIGRSLNACGRIITMDLAKAGGGVYFESFDFET